MLFKKQYLNCCGMGFVIPSKEISKFMFHIFITSRCYSKKIVIFYFLNAIASYYFLFSDQQMHALPNNTIYASRSVDILEDDMDTYKRNLVDTQGH